jgi:hypothetical protein
MRRHTEHHHNSRSGWLRAAVLGANDGIVSTASLVLGVTSAGADHRTIRVLPVVLPDFHFVTCELPMAPVRMM